MKPERAIAAAAGRCAGWSVLAALMTPPTAVVAKSPSPLVVTRAAVTRNGFVSTSVSGDETAAECARFRLGAKDVKAYFAKAARIGARAYDHDLDMSRCQATGSARFANGWRGQWTIDRARRGVLRLADGRLIHFYCLDCSAGRFDPLDEEDRENARALIRMSAGARER